MALTWTGWLPSSCKRRSFRSKLGHSPDLVLCYSSVSPVLNTGARLFERLGRIIDLGGAVLWLCGPSAMPFFLVEAHELGQTFPGPIDPALDGADCATEGFGCFVIRQPLRAHEHDCLALPLGQLGKSGRNILDQDPVLLIREG